MFVGLILRITESPIENFVAFDYQFFFNLLLPPIILASGYELHQANFFRNIGTILTFAFAGTFISALVLGLVLFLWTRIPLDGFSISFVEAISVGATLSATDPVTILAIFNLYKVEPKLYTVIFGESILNDAIAIVLFETAQKYASSDAESLSILNLFEAIGLFLLVFFGSMLVGVIVGILTALGLKYTHVRRQPKIESCLIVLIAYASYFFSNGVLLSGKFEEAHFSFLGADRNRNCVSLVLRDYSEALCLLQHVPSNTVDYQISLPSNGTIVGELHLYLPGPRSTGPKGFAFPAALHSGRGSRYLSCPISCGVSLVKSNQLVYPLQGSPKGPRGGR
jgi:hypothetical protein